MDWTCAGLMTLGGLFALLTIASVKAKWDAAELRARRLDDVIQHIVDATPEGLEPTRPDADDPLRERWLFCGWIATHGHAAMCPWVAALKISG